MTERKPLFGGFGKNLNRKKNIILCLTAILLILAGIWGAKLFGTRMDLRMRRELVRSVKMLASAIPTEEASKLSFTEEDLNRPEFIRISGQLRNFSRILDAEFIESFATKNDQIVFGPGSLPETDPRTAPPGTVLQNPTDDDLNALRNATPSIQGPLKDSFGTYVRATAPVIHPRTGAVLMNITLFQNADLWGKRIRTAQWTPVIITQIPLLILAAGWFLIKYRHRLSIRHHRRLRHMEAITCALVFLLLTAGVTAVVYHEEFSDRDEAFHALALQNASMIRHVFQTLENNLILTGGLFESSEQIIPKEFSSFCKRMLDETAIQYAGWIPRVPEKQRQAFEQKVREETGWSDYRIWEKDPQGRVIPAAARPVHYPVLFIEPNTDTRAIRGFDISSQPDRYAAAEEAYQTKCTEASKPLQDGTEPEILLYNAVASENFQGSIVFSIQPDSIINTLTLRSGIEQNDVRISLIELNDGQPPESLACTDPDCLRHCLEQARHNHLIVPVFVFGKCYLLYIIPADRWLAVNPLHNTLFTAVGGLLLTLLLTSLIGVLANRPALLEKKVQQRTNELRQAEEYARAVLDSSTDAIFIHHPETGAILDFNQTAEQMFGIRREEIGTITVDRLSAGNPDQMQEECLKTIHQAAKGSSQLVEWTARHRDGKTFPLEISMTGAKIGGETRVIADMRNIEERKRTAEELKASEARFQIATDAANIGVWERDLINNRLIWDKRMFAIYGINSEIENAFELWKNSIHPDDVKDVLTESERAERGEQEFNRQFRIILPGGEIRYLKGIGKMLRDETGVPSRMIGINYDVTEQRKAEQALAKSEIRYRSLFEMAAVGISEVSPEGRWIGVNQKLCEITGYSKEELLNLTFQEITHPDDLEQNLALRQEVLDGKSPTYTLQKQYLRKDRSIVWVELTVSLIRNPDNTPDRFIAIVSDITARKNAEKELEENKELLQSTLDGLTAHIALLDETGTILLVNKAWRTFAEQNGLKASLVCEGANYLIACSKAPDSCENQQQNFAKGLQDVLTGQQDSFSMEYTCETEEKEYWFDARVRQVSQSGNNLRRAVVFHTDITDRKNAEKALKQHLDELRRFNQAATGRELRMIELKREVNELCRATGREEVYPLHL